MSTQTLTGRLLTSYKQAFLYMIASFVYSIIAMIVIAIGGMQFFTAMSDLFSGNTVSTSALYLGIIIFAIGFILFMVGFMAALIFAASRGGIIKDTVGFFEAYVVTFKLILELTVAVLIGIVVLILAAMIKGFVGALLAIIGLIIFMLFPSASLFYTINYLIARR